MNSLTNNRLRIFIVFAVMISITVGLYGYYIFTLLATNQTARLLGEAVKLVAFGLTSLIWYGWVRINRFRWDTETAVKSQAIAPQAVLNTFGLINWAFIVFLSRIDFVVVFGVIGLVWFILIYAMISKRADRPSNLIQISVQYALITIILVSARVFTLL